MQAHGKGLKRTGLCGSAAVALALAGLLAGCGTKVVELGICRLPASGQILPDVTEATCKAQQGNWADELTVTAYTEPPVGATVDSIPFAAWTNAACTGDTTPVQVPVKPTSWVAWKIMWGAVDSVTVVANWDSLSYQLLYDGTLPAEVSNSVAWRIEPFSVKCPNNQTMTGIMKSRVVYLRPFTAEREIRGTFNLLGTINDGWSTYQRGTSVSITARFVPAS